MSITVTEPLPIYQGATFDETYYWDIDGVAVDLTGCTARCQGRASYDAADPPWWSVTTENGGIVLGGTAGSVRLIISAAVTTALTPGEGVYDLELIYPSGAIQKFLRGKVTVYAEATK